MIDSTAIFTAVKTLIEAYYPEKTVYTDDIPKSFTRPSYLLEQTNRLETDIGKGLKWVTIELTVTCFTPLDAYSLAKQEDLIAAQAGVMALFARGYIQVGDRAPKVTAAAGEVDSLAAYVDVRVEYADEARTDTTEYPKMGDINIKTKLKEG